MNRLIVFAKAPVEGRVKTRLARETGRVAAAKIYEAMVRDVARLLRESFPGEVFWYVDGDPVALAHLLGGGAQTRPQVGGDLGDRMENAFAEVFSEGAGPVAIIGTDCPELTAEALDGLFAALPGETDGALIPSGDGGYTALALGKRCDEVFGGVPWSTPEVLARTLDCLAGAGRSAKLLPPAHDVDTLADLRGVAERARAGATRIGPALAELLAHYHLDGEEEKSVVDDLNRVVSLTPAARIVSLVPSVTEALFDLGAGGKVVGRTDFCISPREGVEGAPCLGGPKTFDPEKVLALSPDLVFADAEENDRERVEHLIASGVRVFVALPRTLADVSAFLRRMGKLTGEVAAAEEAANHLDCFTPAATGETALCLVWKTPLMAASPDTLTGALVAAAGFTSLSIPGKPVPYPAFTEAELAALAPHTLLLPSEPWTFSRKDAGTLLKISNSARSLLFPGEWVTWYGARTRANVEKLARLATCGTGEGILSIPGQQGRKPLKT